LLSGYSKSGSSGERQEEKRKVYKELLELSDRDTANFYLDHAGEMSLIGKILAITLEKEL
jgi:hypothetical protein